MRNWLHGEQQEEVEDRIGEAYVSEVKASSEEVRKGNENLVEKKGGKEKEASDNGTGRVIVVHCKAGKGRSGSMAISYLVAEEGWTREDALARFTERRMRPGFGPGVSIPSQLRWLSYVERWKDHGKIYKDQSVEVTEVHVWGMRDLVKLGVEGFLDDGKKIKTFHTFSNEERNDIEVSRISSAESAKPAGNPNNNSVADVAMDLIRKRTGKSLSRSSSVASSSRKRDPDAIKTNNSQAMSTDDTLSPASSTTSPADKIKSSSSSSSSVTSSANQDTITRTNTIFRPSKPIILPTSDINFTVERRARPGYGWAMVTSIAHVWFNCFFEGNGPENMNPKNLSFVTDEASFERGAESSGVFETDWDAMDGLKGSSRKGVRAFDRVAIVWKVASPASVQHRSAGLEAHPQEQPEQNTFKPPANIGHSSASASCLKLAEEEHIVSEDDSVTTKPQRPEINVRRATSDNALATKDAEKGRLKDRDITAQSPLKLYEDDTPKSQDKAALDGDSDEDGAEGVKLGITGENDQ